MIELPGRIPVTIHPFFWIFAAFLGFLMGQSAVGMLIWVFIIFFSVLIHEYGHALTAMAFKQKARIQLVALGGLTMFDGPKLKYWQQFLITLNGPLFGFMIFLAATFALQYPWSSTVTLALKWTQFANLFWTFVNLLPVLPLDGGQLMRIVLESFFGVRGYKAALLIGAMIALTIALLSFLIRAFLLGAFFFLFAFQGFETWRKSRFATRDDRSDAVRKKMMRAEEAVNSGNLQAATTLFQEVLREVPNSLFAKEAAQYLALFARGEKRFKEAYDYLLPIKEHLSDDAACVLHELAAMEKNYELVRELSASCYRVAPTRQAALNNARAFAHLGDAKQAGGWLETALQYGGLDLQSILQEEDFAKIKDDPEFKAFIPS